MQKLIWTLPASLRILLFIGASVKFYIHRIPTTNKRINYPYFNQPIISTYKYKYYQFRT